MEVEVVAESAVGADLLAADSGRQLGNEVSIGLLAIGNELQNTQVAKQTGQADLSIRLAGTVSEESRS